jgi:long-chain acyl-CoA synthetase
MVGTSLREGMATGADGARPWHRLYDAAVPITPQPRYATVIEAFETACRAWPDQPLIYYCDEVMTMAQADAESDRVAAAFLQAGFARGDRLAIYLQNTPHFLLGALAAWKLGGIVVTVNPMYRSRELREVLSDSAPRLLLCEANADLQDVRNLATETGIARVIDCAPEPGAKDGWSALDTPSGKLPPCAAEPGDIATLVYTSGTTGPLKAVASSHANLMHGVEVYRTWANLTPDDTIIAIAPLVHVTGIVGYLAPALSVPLPLVLTYRFSPQGFASEVQRHRATFTIGPTTAFIALTEAADVSPDSLRSLTKCYSGGAPIPAAVVDRFSTKFGHAMLGIYGLSEATGPTHIVPRGRAAPVDAATGALSVGIPVSGIDCEIIDETGPKVGPGQAGELLIRGPQIATSYWKRPAESAATFTPHGLHTGDICKMDSDGWFYVIDRIKDQINASGFKVWPREVEDALYEHPAVAECAVVGIPDAYRGETVRACVVLRAGQQVDAQQLEAFSRARLAAYKVPRSIVFFDQLPKTASGKILRRELKLTDPTLFRH